MSESFKSMSHSKWDCKSHLVFIPKHRRKKMCGNIRKQLGTICHALARQKEYEIVEGQLLPDHVHMCISIPPKHASTCCMLHERQSARVIKQSPEDMFGSVGPIRWFRLANPV